MRILVAGGGFAGLEVGRRLSRRLKRSEHEVTVVNAVNYLTYQPFLPEAASGALEPRHVVVPLRQVLNRARVVVGVIEHIDHDAKRIQVRDAAGDPFELAYDVLVLTAGAVARGPVDRALAARALPFKKIDDAMYLRNLVLARLEAAAAEQNDHRRRALLTFMFVGGGYTGVEALAELEDLARAAVKRFYPELRDFGMRWIVVEHAAGVIPELGERMSNYVERLLEKRGIEVRCHTKIDTGDADCVRLTDGEEVRTATLVWTTGVRACPVVANSGFPVDEKGRVQTDEHLRVLDATGRPVPDVWAAGDAAAIPDVVTGKLCPPTAQYAVRQARRLARNVEAVIDGRESRPFEYRNRGLVVALGQYRGAALVFGVQLRGFPAWIVARSYHLWAMPTLARKSRIAIDWAVALVFPRDITSLGGPPDDD
ncbi:MAG: NAD(P)/FAD-dependent oxidoreductase [Acidimicrobiia bacterium]